MDIPSYFGPLPLFFFSSIILYAALLLALSMVMRGTYFLLLFIFTLGISWKLCEPV
ncbi:hypothetical protein HDV64DRAFT_261217, partial [Trichoderma sp. TUCIM 5745]